MVYIFALVIITLTIGSAQPKYKFKIVFYMQEFIEKLNRIEKLTLLGAKNVLNLEEVSMLTGLSKSYIYRLSSSKQIPHYKPTGKVLYFDRLEIENWLKQNRVANIEEIDNLATSYCYTGTMKGGAQ